MPPCAFGGSSSGAILYPGGRNWLKPTIRLSCPLKSCLTRSITPSVSSLDPWAHRTHTHRMSDSSLRNARAHFTCNHVQARAIAAALRNAHHKQPHGHGNCSNDTLGERPGVRLLLELLHHVQEVAIHQRLVTKRGLDLLQVTQCILDLGRGSSIHWRWRRARSVCTLPRPLVRLGLLRHRACNGAERRCVFTLGSKATVQGQVSKLSKRTEKLLFPSRKCMASRRPINELQFQPMRKVKCQG